MWDRATGEPVYNVIVWQDTRTQRICDRLAAAAPGPDGAPDYELRLEHYEAGAGFV